MEKSREEDFYHFPKWRPTTSASSSTFFPTNFCLYPGDGFPSRLNPGNIANLHKKTRDMTPEWIEGLNLRCTTNLDVHKRLCMEWLMGNCTPAGFRFGGMICRKDNDSITSTPVILGDTNPSTLATNLHILYHPRPQIKLETRIQAGPFPYAEDVGDSIGIAEYLGKCSTFTFTVHNPKRTSGRMTIGCLYSLNNNFCAGAELLAEWQQCKLKYTLALAARYSMKKSSVAATISKDALDISFWHQPRAFMQLGASFIWIARTSRTLAQICYQLEMRDSIIKAMIDSDCAVGCTYNRQLKNLASAIGFSVLYCIPTNKFYCGLKFELNSDLK